MTHSFVWCVTWHFTGKTYAVVLYTAECIEKLFGTGRGGVRVGWLKENSEMVT
jgi:hypothetical protein